VVYYNCSKGERLKVESRSVFSTSQTLKKFEKPLDNKQILCYNKDVPRGEEKDILPLRREMEE